MMGSVITQYDLIHILLQSVFWRLIQCLSVGEILDKIIRGVVGSCDEKYFDKELAGRS